MTYRKFFEENSFEELGNRTNFLTALEYAKKVILGDSDEGFMELKR